MRYHSEGKIIKLRGLCAKAPQIVSSHQMQKMLKKEMDGFVAQLFSLTAYRSTALPL